MTYDDKKALTSAFQAVEAAEKLWSARYGTCDTRRGLFFAEDTAESLQKYIAARRAEEEAFQTFVRVRTAYQEMLRVRRPA